MYFQNISDDERETYRLAEFLRKLKEFMKDALFHSDRIGTTIRYFDADVHSAMKRAFELDTADRFKPAIDRVLETSIGDLRRCALTGAALDAKLLIIKRWEGLLGGLGSKALRALLAAINSLLGSLAAAVGFVIEPIKEAKEMLENAVDYAEP